MTTREHITHSCGHTHQHAGLPRDAAERTQEIAARAARPCPACNRAARDAARAAAQTPAARAERQARREAASAAEYLAAERVLDEPAAWPGNRQVARWIEQRMAKAAVNYARNDADSGSVYFDVYDGDGDFAGAIRVADHRAPTGGGFNIERQARAGNSEINVDPHSDCPWREAVTRAQALIEEQENL